MNIDLAYRRLGNVEHALDLGLRLPLPLFNRQQGRLREARAEVAAAEARARGRENDLSRELRTSHSTLARAMATVTLLRDEILPRTHRILQHAEARYATGDSSLSELLPIRRDWARVRLDYLDALYDVMQAWAELSPYIQ